MKNFDHLILIQNEIENSILNAVKTVPIDYSDAIFILDSISNTFRRMLLTQISYQTGLEVKETKKEVGKNVNSEDEKRISNDS